MVIMLLLLNNLEKAVSTPLYIKQGVILTVPLRPVYLIISVLVGFRLSRCFMQMCECEFTDLWIAWTGGVNGTI